MATLALALFVVTVANAQTLTNAFGGLSESSNEPIDIESDRLVVHDKKRYVTFTGKVKAVQGETVLRASELNVHVADDKTASGAKTQSDQQPAETKSTDADDGEKNNDGSDGQTESGKMIGISEDPMDIESDVLVVHDKEKYATFRGNVKAVQGTSTLSAGELTVNYVGGDKLASASGMTKALSAEGQAGGGNAQISKIEAKGDVVITSKRDDGNNVLRGHRLFIDLATNEAWVESADPPEAGSRVHASFASGEATGAAPADGKPAETESQANSASAESGDSKPQDITAGNASSVAPDGVTSGTEARDAGSGVTKNKGNNVTKIVAKGNVVIDSGKDQTTTSDWALYDVPSQLVTVGGNVVLTQGKNVLNGDRLLIDLRTGESRFEHTGGATAGGRIRGLFMPKGGGKAKDTKPADAKDGASPKKAAPGGSEAEDAVTVGEPDDVPLLVKPQL
jgi:lipopolysaccharide export system protein LptA